MSVTLTVTAVIALNGGLDDAFGIAGRSLNTILTEAD
jgi:hypothetical protein